MTETEGEQTPLEEVVDLLRKQKRRWRKWFAAVALVIVGVVLNQVRVESVANNAQDAADQAQEAIDLVLAQRTEARLYTCLKDKKFAEAHNKLVMALATGGGRREITAEDQPLVDEQIVPVPDCSPEGIAQFYEDGLLADPLAAAATTVAPESTSPVTSLRRRPATTTSTSRPSPTSSAPFHSSPRPSDPACTLLPGLTIPEELPCL